MMSNLYGAFLVVASLFVMAALGVLILVAITDVSDRRCKIPICMMN
jgi:hypothetical protein